MNAALVSNFRFTLYHRPLDRDSTFGCVNDASKLDQHAIACGLDDATAMGIDFRIDQFSPMGLLPRNGARLVGFHQPRVANHVGGE